MRYLVFTLGLLVFGTGLAVQAVNAAPVNVNAVTVAEQKASPQKSQKASFFQRVTTFFQSLYEKATSGIAPFSLIVLAILTPPLAVGIASNWDPDKVLIAILLTALCYIPGVVYAIIQAGK
ncbi:MAG: YqaE/Pmp3 family membrane protein [Bacteroidia bacterium]|jgi:uncharacterized membrane protein YqaE (UPF0057 family)|nr:YqaE/Pmp3 family membrane protein [Bacteroidia bacterium]GIV22448.1 MAG: hypothetical protein KatS3mg025_0107 [Bacteroidia bacterium]